MNLRDLRNKLNDLSEEQLSQSAILYDYFSQQQFLIRDVELNPEEEFENNQLILVSN